MNYKLLKIKSIFYIFSKKKIKSIMISNEKKKRKGFRNKMLRKCKDINRNNEPNYFNAAIYNDLEDAASIDDVDNTYTELIEDKW